MNKFFSKILWEMHSLVYDFKVGSRVHRDLQDDIINVLDIKKAHKLLDAGIGTGALESALLRKDVKDLSVLGVDLSEKMLNKAEEKLANEFREFKLLRLDLNNSLPFTGNYFDRIASSNTFYILHNKLDFLKEAYRVLKPQGKIVLSTPHEKFKGTEIMKYHYKKANKFSHYVSALVETIVALVLVLPFELLITIAEKSGQYEHLGGESLQKLFKEAGFDSHEITLAFADQNWLITATK